MTGHTHLLKVVELNEGTKQILDESHQVSLRALDAVVKSTRASAKLRGFVAVSSQMSHWSRELHVSVTRVSDLSASQVADVSGLLRQARLVKLLDAAAAGSPAKAPIHGARDRAQQQTLALQERLVRLHRETTLALEDLQQLGLMASVLARAALIEATCGDERERRELTEVAREFADRSEQVNTVARRMLTHHLEKSP
ncbi:MAG: hypothetical protein ABW321_10650 [Polyangiales bacterium]